MFIYTAKLTRRRAVIIVLVFAAVMLAVILIAGGQSESRTVGAFDSVVRSGGERAEFLSSLGWEIDETPIETQTVIIPRTFSDVYAEYNELQKTQGFDLSEYGGCEAVRYTYAVKNHPSAEGGVYADIIVYRGRVIAGDIQSAELGGFMHGLEYPS